MIENSYVTIDSDGSRVTVEFWEDGEVREGPATFPARYASFAAIIQYAETQLNTHRLGISERVEIQGLLGSPWPHKKLRYEWSALSQ
jgi:hypothetical protein